MLAALPLILSLAPEIARWLGGDQAAGVTAKVTDAVRTVTGSEDPDQAAKTIAADPAKAAELRVQLAKIAADAEAAQRQADLETLKATFAAQAAKQQAELEAFKASAADTQSARQETLDLAKSGSPLAWGAPVLSGIILIAFAIILYVVLELGVKQESLALANVLLGTLTAMATQVANYWLGSSLGSTRKDAAIRDLQSQFARSVPKARGSVNETDALNQASLARARFGRPAVA